MRSSRRWSSAWVPDWAWSTPPLARFSPTSPSSDPTPGPSASGTRKGQIRSRSGHGSTWTRQPLRTSKRPFAWLGCGASAPSGIFEQDDMDDWQGCTQTCRGVVSRRYQLNYEMGLGHERFDADLMAWASDFRISESNHRHFYRRWAQLMTAKSWAEV